MSQYDRPLELNEFLNNMGFKKCDIVRFSKLAHEFYSDWGVEAMNFRNVNILKFYILFDWSWLEKLINCMLSNTKRSCWNVTWVSIFKHTFGYLFCLFSLYNSWFKVRYKVWKSMRNHYRKCLYDCSRMMINIICS